jgi:exodeoxyribonuclease VII small subunit
MARAKPHKEVNDLTYEAALRELQAVVQRLEGGQQPLEESIALFERGQALLAHCGRLLDQAELRLKTLAPDAAGVVREVDGGSQAEDDGE